MYTKNQIITLVVVLLVVAGLGFWTYQVNQNVGYSVVYLTTGEVYVGKLSTFPDFELKDAYILQIAKDATDPNKSNFQLAPVREALWSPRSIHLNREHVVFYGEILPDSQIAKTLAGKK